MSLSDQLIPISVTKSFNRETFPGKAYLEKIQHPTLMEGQKLDRSLGDAQSAVNDGMKYVNDKITTYMKLIILGSDGMFPDGYRPVLYIKDVILFIKDIKDFIEQLKGLIEAMEGVAGYTWMVQARTQAYMISKLNGIANLMHEICNFRMPDLPSIPSLYGIFNFNGFHFPKFGWQPIHPAWDNLRNFAFGDCHIRNLAPNNTNIFRDWPKSRFHLTSDGEINIYPSGSLVSIPMNRGFFEDDPKAPLPSTYTPILKSSWSPTDGYTGSFPNKDAIKSPFAFQPSEFKEHALSLVGDPTSIIANFNNNGDAASNHPMALTTTMPDGSVTFDYQPGRDSLKLPVRAFCRSNVRLGGIVPEGWDAGDTSESLRWATAWAWVVYVGDCRSARQGVWVKELETLYLDHIQPSVTELVGMDIPWNDSVGDTPYPTFPLLDVLVRTAGSPAFGNLLWKLSFVEAALLAYPRDTRWDAYSDAAFLSGPTGEDADYLLVEPLSKSNVVIVLETPGLTDFPSAISVPDNAISALQSVVNSGHLTIGNVASTNELQVAVTSARGGAMRSTSRYIYTVYAENREIDYHSQYWKEFSNNWNDLLTLEDGLLRTLLRYPAALNSAINPLADPSLYYRIKQDFRERDASWVPGNPVLPTPFFPVLTNRGTSIQRVEGEPNGWLPSSDGLSDYTFDESSFRQRSDVAMLPETHQQTLILYNQNYSDLKKHASVVDNTYGDSLTAAAASMAEAIQKIADVAPYVNGAVAELTGLLGTLSVQDNLVASISEEDQAGIAYTNPTSRSAASTNLAMLFSSTPLLAAQKQIVVDNVNFLTKDRLTLVGSAQGNPATLDVLNAMNLRWSSLMSWFTKLQPNYTVTTEDTPIPDGFVAGMGERLAAYSISASGLHNILQ